MIAISLQSGSDGNCIYVEDREQAVLFDAGIAAGEVEKRLAARGRDLGKVGAIIISHDHSDHVRCAGSIHRKYQLPLYLTRRTLHATGNKLGPLKDIRFFSPGDCLALGSLKVETTPTPHDAAEGVVFVVHNEVRRLGILTDLGHAFEELKRIIATLDAVFLESNYDPVLLKQSTYPKFLQKRIRGGRGHLSNHESAELLSLHATSRMRWACLAHLSEANNTPQLALMAHRLLVGNRFPLMVADRYEPTEALEV